MDALGVSGLQLSPPKDFDQKEEIRAEKHERLRGRNNVTSCRSPTREFNTKLIKKDLKEKRHQEFLRRRSVSPDPYAAKSTDSSTKKRKSSSKTFSMKHHSSDSKSETLHTNLQNAFTANGHPVMILTSNSSITDGPGISKWAALWSDQVPPRLENSHTRKQVSASITVTKESNQNKTKSTDKRENSINAQKTSYKSLIQTENTQQKKILRDTGVQTDSGLITVKESDIQRIADYLQEALWREDTVKKKLADLQERTSNLMNSSSKIWTARCSEDLLRNKIKALEAQLQVCLQKFPKDGMKKVMLQMEKQKLVYEEKALVALQKVTQEKAEALTKAETMQDALITAKAEAQRWQSLYEELKLSSTQLKEHQHLSNEHLQQLHNQVELSRSTEAELKEEVMSLRQERKELQYNIGLLEEANQVLREEIQHLRDGSNEVQDFMMQDGLTSEEAEPLRLTIKRDSQVEEQLRHTQEKLQMKERECEELQTELHVMEQECQSSQARLSQCREELRQLSHRRRKPARCGSWWRLFVFFLLLLAVAGVVMLWLWHPPFREQVEDLYSDIETRIDNYLLEMASPRYSGCFRPI